jgi:hypothetical protein
LRLSFLNQSSVRRLCSYTTDGRNLHTTSAYVSSKRLCSGQLAASANCRSKFQKAHCFSFVRTSVPDHHAIKLTANWCIPFPIPKRSQYFLRPNESRCNKTWRRSESFYRCGAAKTVYDSDPLAQSLWTNTLLRMCVHRRRQRSCGTSREKWSGAYLRNAHATSRRQGLANISRHFKELGAAG